MIDIMSTIQRSLTATTVYISILAFANISPAALAWKGDQVAPWVGTTLSGKECGGVRVGYGPFDYLQRAGLPGELGVVEQSHFTAKVENLEGGETGTVIADLHYTLGSWPNHHRALNSVLKYRLQHLGDWPDAVVPPAECYMQRAIKFNPNDPKPYMMYGLLLHKVGNYDQALEAYKTATRLLPNDIITQYNMALTLVELKKYEEANKLAEKVYAAGIPLPGLKKKLIAAGFWKNGSQSAEPATIPQANTTTKVAPPSSTTPLQEEMSTSKPLTR